MVMSDVGNKQINSGGSVLVLTLWVLFFLAALAVAVGGHVATNLKVAGKIKGRIAAYYLAKAGAEKAISESKNDSNAWDSLNEVWSYSEDLFRDANLGQGSYSVYYAYTSQFGGAATNYGMYDEERKININKANEPLLRTMLENIGHVDSMTASDIAAAIVDWRDQNDVVLTGGAENSYYGTLSEPYSCHNGDFQSLHELLLVKGMSSVLFRKLRPYITIYGIGKVNINTADPVVLVCTGEAGGGGDRAACRLLADKIARFRAAGNTFTDPSLAGQLNAFVQLTPVEKTVLARMTGGLTIKSSCFGGIAGGRAQGSSIEDRQIEFVFDRQRGVKLYWHEF
jgi:type II secretory pathway component PulK